MSDPQERAPEQRFKVRAEVTLKPSVLDPQGAAIGQALAAMGMGGVGAVRQGKIFDFDVAAETAGDAEARAAEICERLLANTVIEQYRVAVVSGG